MGGPLGSGEWLLKCEEPRPGLEHAAWRAAAVAVAAGQSHGLSHQGASRLPRKTPPWFERRALERRLLPVASSGHGLHVYGGRNTSSATSTRTAVNPIRSPRAARASSPKHQGRCDAGSRELDDHGPRCSGLLTKASRELLVRVGPGAKAHTAWRVVLQMPDSALSRPRGRRLPEATLSGLRTANGVASIHCEHCGHPHGEGRNLELLVPAQEQSPQQQPKKN